MGPRSLRLTASWFFLEKQCFREAVFQRDLNHNSIKILTKQKKKSRPDPYIGYILSHSGYGIFIKSVNKPV
jgi:hypothetical protein